MLKGAGVVLEDATALLTIHHLGISQSERILWLGEELGIAWS
ncbi:thioredoxin domain-containing protein [Plastoroseomonas arctica]|nr:hypothetical protein [Plastoroseomonas arctica]